ALHHVGQAGVAAALAKMAFGNHLGFAAADSIRQADQERYFAFLVEHTDPLPSPFQIIGHTTADPVLTLNGESHALDSLLAAWTGTLEAVYPTKPEIGDRRSEMEEILSFTSPIHTPPSPIHHPRSTISKPKVLIPCFPGTNSEYDSAKAFREAGADAEILVFRNLTARHIDESIKALATQISKSQILMFPGGFSAGDEPDGSAKFIATIIRSPRVADAIMELLKNRDGLILGICNGFQALIKTGLVPYGEIREPNAAAPTLVHNSIGRHISCYANTRIVSTLSPWLAATSLGEIHTVPVSHGEGKFYASADVISALAKSGQIATQYCDATGLPSMDIAINPNGSLCAIEGITSPCGKVFGKMAHSERAGSLVAKNIAGNKHQPIFEAGVRYFA
ncbi:MAG: phosphoribosylformylglycinamidine synthase subunit PurQ, partial [Gloeobacteraceae cyanobacterium ES-bin-144]|nr:phosphoribosylformylglycinamidine synthase subunit PurQ [Verrucomicrobiales bacterium]